MITIGNIKNYGIYDSQEFYPNAKVSKPRKAQYFEFEYCLGDGGKTITNGVEYERGADTIFLRKPSSVGYSKLPFKCYFFHLEIDKDNPYYNQLCSLPDCYRVFDSKKYLDLFYGIISHLAQTNGIQDELITARILEIIYYLKTDASPNHYLQTYGYGRFKNLANVLAYINLNFKNKITLIELAKIAGYSPQHLLVIFSKTFGQTPIEYVIKKRLAFSLEKLSNTSQQLCQIAQDCGFSTQSYYTKQFKKEYGVTPAKYRKRIWMGYDL